MVARVAGLVTTAPARSVRITKTEGHQRYWRSSCERAFICLIPSGLVFPGIGHMVLKQYLRGSILILFTLIALSVIVTVAVRRALNIVDSINRGEIPVESGAITELVSNSISSADNLIVKISLLVVGACWVVGIIDSYRVDITQEK